MTNGINSNDGFYSNDGYNSNDGLQSINGSHSVNRPAALVHFIVKLYSCTFIHKNPNKQHLQWKTESNVNICASSRSSWWGIRQSPNVGNDLTRAFSENCCMRGHDMVILFFQSFKEPGYKSHGGLIPFQTLIQPQCGLLICSYYTEGPFPTILIEFS